MTAPLLVLNGVSKRFGGLLAVDDVNVQEPMVHGSMEASRGPAG
jgi:ABC-type branched-subunit amino acid transport system ATPase component